LATEVQGNQSSYNRNKKCTFILCLYGIIRIMFNVLWHFHIVVECFIGTTAKVIVNNQFGIDMENMGEISKPDFR